MTRFGVSVVMDLETGAQFGRYRIVRKLGEGGMGAVYEAEHLELRKRVAIKILSGSLSKGADARLRFGREAQTAARLEHPNAVAVTDVGVIDETPFLVMEYLEGTDLESVFEREGRLSTERIVEIVLPVASALAAAHALGIVHRDIKPQNVFLARSKLGEIVPKLLDFGISKVADNLSGGDLTRTTSMLGTPYYMSPEQVQAAKYADARSDQYSLAVLMYQGVSGRLPFEAQDLFPLLSAITLGHCPPLSEVCPDSPPAFRAVIARAMSVDKNRRYASVAEFARALLPFAAPRVRAIWEPVFAPNGEAPPVESVPPETLDDPPLSKTTDAIAATIPGLNTSVRGPLLGGAALLAGGAALVYFTLLRPSALSSEPPGSSASSAQDVPVSSPPATVSPTSSADTQHAPPPSASSARKATPVIGASRPAPAAPKPAAPKPARPSVFDYRVSPRPSVPATRAPEPDPRPAPIPSPAPEPTPQRTRNNAPILE